MKIQTPMLLEGEIAKELGWTNIKFIQGVLIGTPPVDSGIVSVRGESMIPQYVRSSIESMELQAKHGIEIKHSNNEVSARSSSALMSESYSLDVRDVYSRLECMRLVVGMVALSLIRRGNFIQRNNLLPVAVTKHPFGAESIKGKWKSPFA